MRAFPGAPWAESRIGTGSNPVAHPMCLFPPRMGSVCIRIEQTLHTMIGLASTDTGPRTLARGPHGRARPFQPLRPPARRAPCVVATSRQQAMPTAQPYGPGTRGQMTRPHLQEVGPRRPRRDPVMSSR